MGMCCDTLDKMPEYQAFSSGGVLSGLAGTLVQLRQFGSGEARAVRHSLAQSKFRKTTQLLHRDGRRLDNVAELRMVPDLQTCDPETLRKIELQSRDDLSALAPQPPMGVGLTVEPDPDGFPIVQSSRNIVRKRLRQFINYRQTQRNSRSHTGYRLGNLQRKQFGHLDRR